MVLRICFLRIRLVIFRCVDEDEHLVKVEQGFHVCGIPIRFKVCFREVLCREVGRFMTENFYENKERDI